MSGAETDRNKANVVAFYDLMFNRNRPAEAIEMYTGAHMQTIIIPEFNVVYFYFRIYVDKWTR